MIRLLGLWRRWSVGERWAWRSPSYDALLPGDLDEVVMGLQSQDRFHAKQGRSTARVRFDSGLSVYLKRHSRLPWAVRLAAWLNPSRRLTPAGAEWRHLRTARDLGLPVPDTAAAGERIGPRGALSSYLLVVELVGCLPLHEAVPLQAARLTPEEFAAWKRRVIDEAAGMTARLHAARLFHKDLYLCHFFLDLDDPADVADRLYLIDLHRLGRHRWGARRWQIKDLAQLLFSTVGVEGLTGRDIARFWIKYRRMIVSGRTSSRFLAALVRAKAARYARHNRVTPEEAGS